MSGKNLNSNKSVVSNFLWRFMERCGAEGVAFIVSIVLARLLTPEDYAAVALINVFTVIMSVFVDCGFTTALIQKKNIGDLEFSTVFYFNIVMCLFIYAILFISAPFIAAFYKMPELTAMVRVSSIVIIISGVRSIQSAYVSKNMLFKRFFFSTLIGTVVAAVAGIVMAYMGFGTWALIAQHLINTLIDTAILWITVKWRPKWMFSFEKLKGLLSYGWKIFVSKLLDQVYNNLRSLIIGKLYTSSDLSFYNKGKQFPNIIVININSSIDSVLLPTMSKAQDSREKVKAMTRRSMKTSIYIMAPLMMGLAFCAEPIIRLILTEKWLPCVPFMQIFCITYMFYPMHTANLNAIKAMGRSDLFLILEVLKKVVGIVLLLSTMWFGVMPMTYSLLVSTLCSTIINSFPNRKLLDYSYFEQIKDILPGIVLAVAMGICVWFFKFLPVPDIVILIVQIITGAVIYIGGSLIFKLESFSYIFEVMKSFLHRKKSDK